MTLKNNLQSLSALGDKYIVRLEYCVNGPNNMEYAFLKEGIELTFFYEFAKKFDNLIKAEKALTLAEKTFGKKGIAYAV